MEDPQNYTLRQRKIHEADNLLALLVQVIPAHGTVWLALMIISTIGYTRLPSGERLLPIGRIERVAQFGTCPHLSFGKSCHIGILGIPLLHVARTLHDGIRHTAHVAVDMLLVFIGEEVLAERRVWLGDRSHFQSVRVIL